MPQRRFNRLPTSRPMSLQVGQSVEGCLRGIAPEGDHHTNVLYLVDDDGIESRVWSSTWLDNLITESHVGLYIRITRGEDIPATRRGFSAMKTYSVEIDSNDFKAAEEAVKASV